ncbi:MAG: GYD domain-containing protein [Alphaproteobacteria bacterium]
MSHYIMLTRLSHEALKAPKSLTELSDAVSARIKEECGNVKWLMSFATLGPADYVDIFEAPDTETAMKVATIVRTFGHATTEIWPAVDWGRFKELVRYLPSAVHVS